MKTCGVVDIHFHVFLTLAMNGDETKLYAMAGFFPGKSSDYIYMILYMFYIGSTVVKVLCYISEGRWFDSRWCQWNVSLT